MDFSVESNSIQKNGSELNLWCHIFVMEILVFIVIFDHTISNIHAQPSVVWMISQPLMVQMNNIENNFIKIIFHWQFPYLSQIFHWFNDCKTNHLWTMCQVLFKRKSWAPETLTLLSESLTRLHSMIPFSNTVFAIPHKMNVDMIYTCHINGHMNASEYSWLYFISQNQVTFLNCLL